MTLNLSLFLAGFFVFGFFWYSLIMRFKNKEK
jgi:hypothetical protein